MIKQYQDLIIEWKRVLSFLQMFICPFAQRAVITARQKNLDIQFKEVSLTNKEPFFTQAYKKALGHDPTSDGKVPTLIHGNIYLTESDLVSWYLAEQFKTGNQLIPINSLDRFRLRYFSQKYPAKLISAFYAFAGHWKKQPQEIQKLKENLNKVLSEIEEDIVGPYILGQDFTLGDIFIYPWFERWCVLERYLNIKIDNKYQKIINFINSVQARPSVKNYIQDQQFFIQGYKTYFQPS